MNCWLLQAYLIYERFPVVHIETKYALVRREVHRNSNHIGFCSERPEVVAIDNIIDVLMDALGFLGGKNQRKFRR